MRGRPLALQVRVRQRALFRTLLPVACIALWCHAPARAATVEGAVSVSLARPTSSDLSDVYPGLAGFALDVRIRHSDQISLKIAVSPMLGQGTPRTGSLAEDAEAKLLLIPGHLSVEYSPGRGSIRPYFGLGAGAVHVKESLSFRSPLGDEDASTSTTRLSFDVLAGVEKAARTTMFAELHYQHASLSGVEDQPTSGVSLANLQLRLGVRTRLK